MDLKSLFLTAGLMASIVINLYAAWGWYRSWRFRLDVAIYRQSLVDQLEMTRFESEDSQPFVPVLTEIIVPDEFARQELLKFSRYIHDLQVDTDYVVVNTMAHLYQAPHLIRVQPSTST